MKDDVANQIARTVYQFVSNAININNPHGLLQSATTQALRHLIQTNVPEAAQPIVNAAISAFSNGVSTASTHGWTPIIIDKLVESVRQQTRDYAAHMNTLRASRIYPDPNQRIGYTNERHDQFIGPRSEAEAERRQIRERRLENMERENFFRERNRAIATGEAHSSIRSPPPTRRNVLQTPPIVRTVTEDPASSQRRSTIPIVARQQDNQWIGQAMKLGARQLAHLIRTGFSRWLNRELNNWVRLQVAQMMNQGEIARFINAPPSLQQIRNWLVANRLRLGNRSFSQTELENICKLFRKANAILKVTVKNYLRSLAKPRRQHFYSYI